MIVLDTLRKQKLYGKLSKCEFWLDKITFFDHIVYRDGVLANLQKIEAVMEWPMSKSVSKI